MLKGMATLQTSMTALATPLPAAEALAKPPEHNRIDIDFRSRMPRPKVRGDVIDFHCHLLAARHAKGWFEAAAHYGIDRFVTMCQLEEAMGLQRDWGDRLQFIAVPAWKDPTPNWIDDWMRRLEGCCNLCSRIVKIHMAPRTMAASNYRLYLTPLRTLFRDIPARVIG